MREPGWPARFAARIIWASRVVDRAFGRFDRLRTRIVAARAGDAFYDAYNDIAFSGQAMYRPGSDVFRDDLFPWEREAVKAWFPAPPATVLIGGAGGGREALALARRGYAVTTFDPALGLVASFEQHHSDATHPIAAFAGRYEDLPLVRDPRDGAAAVDLSQRGRFDAAIFGWASYSNLRSETTRVAALRAMGRLTAGPMLLSYFPHLGDSADAHSRRGSFTVKVGYFRNLTEHEVRGEIEAAGLDVLWLLHDTGWPRAIVRRRD
jgi:hypothetical protein